MRALLLITLPALLLPGPVKEPPVCEMSEAVIRISLKVLLSREMVVAEDKTLNIRASQAFACFIPGEIKTDSSSVQVLVNQLYAPDVTITNILAAETNGAKVFFLTASTSGQRYSGTISLKYFDGSYIFDAIHYVSEVD